MGTGKSLPQTKLFLTASLCHCLLMEKMTKKVQVLTVQVQIQLQVLRNCTAVVGLLKHKYQAPHLYLPLNF